MPDKKVMGPAHCRNLTSQSASRTTDDKPSLSVDLRPASIFSHHMVFQRRKPILIFGTGTPGKPVIARMRMAHSNAPLVMTGNGSSDSIMAMNTVNGSGRWLVELPALEQEQAMNCRFLTVRASI